MKSCLKKVDAVKPLLNRIFLLLLFSLFFTDSIALASSGQKKIYVIFRYDDYLASSFGFEDQIIDAFRKNNIKITLAVSPYLCGAEKHVRERLTDSLRSEVLQKSINDGMAEIALHGFCHRSISQKYDKNKGDSEFEGLTYADQIQKLSQAKITAEKFFNVSIKTFVPPWNSYDITTLRALETLGVRVISADKSRLVTRTSQVTFLPKTCNILELRRTINAARRLPDDSPVIVCLFHPYDFAEVDKNRAKLSFASFSDLLSWISEQADVVTLTIGEAAQEIKGLDADRYLIYKFYAQICDWLPNFIECPTEIYLSKKLVLIYVLKLVVFLLCVFFVLYLCLIRIRQKFLKKLKKTGGKDV